jgi:hypothetical protein
MIIDSLNREIDIKTNNLVIDHITRLFASEDWVGQLTRRSEAFQHFDQYLITEYQNIIWSYTSFKLKTHRLKKAMDQLDRDYDAFDDIDYWTLKVAELRQTKNKLRDEMIKRNINYKQYHNTNL